MPENINPDLAIAQSVAIRQIKDVAAELCIPGDDLEYYGKYKAKLPLRFIDEEKIKKANLFWLQPSVPHQQVREKQLFQLVFQTG